MTRATRSAAGKVQARTAVVKSTVRTVDRSGFIDAALARSGGEGGAPVPPAAVASVQACIEPGGCLLARIVRAY